MAAFNKIHKAGVCHDDVTEDNVLLSEDGRVVVIDFEEAVQVKCHRSLAIPRLGEIQPDANEFRCDELWQLGCAMRMWKPCTHLCLIASYLCY